MKNIQAILHKKSAALAQNGIDPKLPKASQLEYGELAINFADGHETLSIKNSSNEIVTFTNDQYWKDKELVIASALNDLNSRILAITVPTNVSDLVNDVPYLAASDLDITPTENSTNGVTSGGVYDYITEIEEATSAALNDLNERIDNIHQIQADWNQTDDTADDYIKNKPTIPTTSTTLVEDDPNPVSGGAVYDVIVENEQITSAALNDLNERIDNIPELPENIVTGASTAYTIWCGTQAEYDALQTYDNNTVYLIKENA